CPGEAEAPGADECDLFHVPPYLLVFLAAPRRVMSIIDERAGMSKRASRLVPGRHIWYFYRITD
ncbi:MAG: hypothetical protein FWE70_04850, partial [Oscillospiraceae bacterium]|nr:hypothetical protein [Oscillospiraceae bacterium]